MRKTTRGRAVILAAATVLGLVNQVRGATTRTWDRGAGTGLWSGITNWSGNVEPTLDDPVILPTPIPGGFPNISLSGTEHALNLTINASYAIGGNFLQIHGAGGPITVASGASASISSTLTGTAGLSKGGGGTLTVTGNNGFTGNVNITGGTFA